MKTTVLQILNLLILILVPKCSLCLFAATGAIAFCGLPEKEQPLWEYLVIGFITLMLVGTQAYKLRENFNTLSVSCIIAGLVSICYFLIAGEAKTPYYVGVSFLMAGTLLLYRTAFRRRISSCYCFFRSFKKALMLNRFL